MKRSLIVLVVGVVVLLLSGSAVATLIAFELADLGSDRFEYNYTIENDTLSVPIEQFTIWFDEELYDNVTDE